MTIRDAIHQVPSIGKQQAPKETRKQIKNASYPDRNIVSYSLCNRGHALRRARTIAHSRFLHKTTSPCGLKACSGDKATLDSGDGGSPDLPFSSIKGLSPSSGSLNSLAEKEPRFENCVSFLRGTELVRTILPRNLADRVFIVELSSRGGDSCRTVW